jgi:alcohol dehydrogenase (cytochrome c)
MSMTQYQFRKLSICLVSCTLGALAGSAAAQTATDLIRDAAEPNNVLTYGLGYNAQRYSTLTQINKRNVRKLAPVCALELENTYGEIGQPPVMDGVMYVADVKWAVAIDAVTGKMLWRTDTDFDPDSPRIACCGVTKPRRAALTLMAGRMKP